MCCVPEIEWVTRWGIVWHDILPVNVTELVRKFSIWKCSIGLITNSGLTKINHSCCRETIIYQHHCSKLGKGTTKTVSCCLNRVGRVKIVKSLYLSKNCRLNWVGGIEKSFVNLTVACWPFCVCYFCCWEISKPVLKWFWSTESNIDWFVWGKVSNKTFGVI